MGADTIMSGGGGGNIMGAIGNIGGALLNTALVKSAISRRVRR